MLRRQFAAIIAFTIAIASAAHGQRGPNPPPLPFGIQQGAPLSNDQLRSLNREGAALEADIALLNAQQAEVSRLLAATAQGAYLVMVGETNDANMVVMTPAQLSGYIDRQVAQAGVSSVKARTDRYNTLVGRSASIRQGLEASRAEIQRQRTQKISRLDTINRAVRADADRPGSAYTPNPPQAGAWMTGTFDTSFGEMRLGPGGGTYGSNNPPYTVKVTSINGPVMEGEWRQSSAGRRCGDGTYRGRFKFEFTDTGFTGSWSYCEEPMSGNWSGTRKR